jgi:hypothetical protein
MVHGFYRPVFQVVCRMHEGDGRRPIQTSLPKIRKDIVMSINNLNAEDLDQFIGSEQWYRHSLVRSITYTDGAKYVADHGGAYWLLDEIALAQKFSAAVRAEPFQVWKLSVNDRRGLLTCDDGNGNVVYTKPIPFTDFPLTEIKFYFTDNVILLPSEY